MQPEMKLDSTLSTYSADPKKGSFRYFSLKTTETLTFSLVAIINSSLLLKSIMNEFGEIYFFWRW